MLGVGLVSNRLSPLQSIPILSRVYPVLQPQENDPGVLVQVCEQFPLLATHSSISAQQNCLQFK